MARLSGCQNDALFLQRMVHSMEQEVTVAVMKIAQETSLVCAEICTSRLRDVHKQMLLALEEERQRSKALVEEMSPQPERRLFDLIDSDKEEDALCTRCAAPSPQDGDIEASSGDNATETLPQSWDLYAQFKGSFYGQLAWKTGNQSRATLSSSIMTPASVSDRGNEQDDICRPGSDMGVDDSRPPDAETLLPHESLNFNASFGPSQKTTTAEAMCNADAVAATVDAAPVVPGQPPADVDWSKFEDAQAATGEKRTPEPKGCNLHRSTPEPSDADSTCSWITRRRQPSSSVKSPDKAICGMGEKLNGFSPELPEFATALPSAIQHVTRQQYIVSTPRFSDGAVVSCSAFDSDCESADFRSCGGDGQSDLELDLPTSVDVRSRSAREDSVEIYRRRITRRNIVHDEACTLRFVGFESDGSVLQSFTHRGGRHISRHMHPAWQTFLPGAGIQE
eukprot:TRINITY_DN57173_c0_g1_i1.p1 TRINITY_DN57173_c0_g1~~TRINITY_DN57173_c0_g1_i1.p1  ORF type:complete len:451 (+),score=55.17 TRINITY_DN57173_c0_g1_i1:75-1427(+)